MLLLRSPGATEFQYSVIAYWGYFHTRGAFLVPGLTCLLAVVAWWRYPRARTAAWTCTAVAVVGSALLYAALLSDRWEPRFIITAVDRVVIGAMALSIVATAFACISAVRRRLSHRGTR
jgi:hypothetical protein